MASMVHVVLLSICLSGSIEIASADWGNPPIFEPDPCDEVVRKFGYDNDTRRANIALDEEVEYAVCIASLNYKDDAIPSIGSFNENKSNFVLGAEFRRNDTTRMWSLWITKKQDYETPIMRQYRFSIISGVYTFQISLNILNIDDNPPVIQADERTCKIEENCAGSSKCTYNVSDADGSIKNVKIRLSSSPEGNNFDFITSPVPNSDYQLTAFLNVTKCLDFETVSMYMLLIRGVDGAGNEGNFSGIVEVIDMPDEPPVWTRLTAAENLPEKSSKSFEVSAIDGDVQIKAEINYRIEVSDPTEAKYFEVDPKTGIVTINPIDRDALQREVFRFLIIAYEIPEPESKINATIVVIVEDINDHKPEITPDVLNIEIDEETYTTLEFDPSIAIKDPDLAENGQFSVSLIDDSKFNWSSAFLVVPTSGYQSGIFTISVANASLLDYEDENWRVINMQIRAIEVNDTSHIGLRNINVRLNNWNDELPIFDEKNPSNVSINEDVTANYPIATVHATDRDVDDNVTHSLVAQQSLTIDDKTGAISTNQNDALDYESMPVVVIQVVATDLVNHKTYTTLTINVIDVNDVPPKLYLPKQSPTLEEELPNGTEIKALINATDVDTDAELIFKIDWDNTKAHKRSVEVDESFYRDHLDIRTDYPEGHKRYAKGTLFVTGRIDYEEFDVIFLTISVIDRTTVHNDNTTSGSLTLNIEDINDNSPIFDPTESMSVVENQIKDALIGSVTAKDKDGPEFNKVSYFIEPINGTKENLIYINNLTGVIRVDLNKGIDAEEYEYLYYNVIATDSQRNSTKIIEIYVIDQNDEVPYVLHDKFNSTIRIREKSPNGTQIVRVQADDDDRTYPFNNVSYLINANYSSPLQYFSMGRFDGLIVVNLTDGYILDRDFGPPEFSLNLKLRDNYLVDYVIRDSNAIDTMVTVILEDVNDQKPKLPVLGDPAASISENTKKDVLILTIVAEDHDDPNTNNTKVFYEIKNISSPDKEENDYFYDDCKSLFYVKTRDQSAADIFTSCDLKGYYGRWIIELYAQDLGTDPGPCNDTKNYVVQVTDFNYNKPEILFPTSKKIPLRKEQTIHAPLRTYDDQLLNDFKATDKDHGASGIVTFSLSSTTSDHEYFEIESISTNVGQLRLAKNVDVEKQNSFTLTLKATDGGNPPLEASQEFTVVFVTKSGPKFDKNEWTIWIKENKTGLDESLIIPEARDMVGEAGENTVDIYYFLSSAEKDAEFFDLHKVTRNLTLTSELDREKQEIMTLHVIGTTDQNGPPGNPPADSVLKITVVVVDENDNPPIFESKIYRGGVAMEDNLDKVILIVKATDADLNETLTYSTISNSLTTSDSSLESITNPFSMDLTNGEWSLKFSVSSSMKGYFHFDIIVRDKDLIHNDTTAIQIYIVLQKNRVEFTLNNVASYVKQEKMFIIESFSNAYGYLCNVDDIKSTVGANDQVLDNTTTLTTHFISSQDNLPIDSSAIILSSSDLQTISNLKATLLTKSLYLLDAPTGSSTVTDDTQETVHWILVTLTIFFCLCSITLLVVFVLKTRRLNQRLDKLAITKYGSQESGLDRAGVVPTTNQFAMAGSNPMWKTPEKSMDDNISQGSGDSDLIGVEENPDFGYVNGAMIGEDRWENSTRESVNPIFANRDVISGGLFDRIYPDLQGPHEDKQKY